MIHIILSQCQMVHEVVDIEVLCMTILHITKLLADMWSVFNITSYKSPTLTGLDRMVVYGVSIDAAVAGSWSTTSITGHYPGRDTHHTIARATQTCCTLHLTCNI